MTKMMRSVVLTAVMLVALGACSAPPVSPDRAALNANTPGWTGSTFVVGSTSTVAGDAQATYLQQKWGVGRAR
jgi:ABC-type phosphate transport system substrate-binding protein